MIACMQQLQHIAADYHFFALLSDQFTSLHKKETVDPCGVAGIFGCNAGATTHAARSGPGYVNINGYKVSLVDVDITLLG
jgi:hypothetical protein